MLRIAAKLGLHETIYEALKDMFYCHWRAHKYAMWHYQAAAARRGGNALRMEPGMVQEKLENTAALARTFCRSARYGIELKHLLHAWSDDAAAAE